MRLDDFARAVATEAIADFRRLGKVEFPSLDEAANSAAEWAASHKHQRQILDGESAPEGPAGESDV